MMDTTTMGDQATMTESQHPHGSPAEGPRVDDGRVGNESAGRSAREDPRGRGRPDVPAGAPHGGLAADLPHGITGDTALPPPPSAYQRFEALAGQHLDALYARALRLARNRADADDLVQEAMLKAWRGFHSFQEGTNARAWLLRILRNAHTDMYRRSARRPEHVSPEDIGEFSLHLNGLGRDQRRRDGDPEALLDRMMDEEVTKALDSLPARDRAPVVLAGLHGFSYADIAKTLDIPVGTVMSRLHRARQRLQAHLSDYARDRYRVGRRGLRGTRKGTDTEPAT